MYNKMHSKNGSKALKLKKLIALKVLKKLENI